MPINANAYNPKPTAEDWDWAWDKILEAVQASYIEAYKAEVDKKTQNTKINNANNLKSRWINQVIDAVAHPQLPIFKTESARWFIEQIHLDEPDYPYKPTWPVLDGTEEATTKSRRQHVDDLKKLKENNLFV